MDAWFTGDIWANGLLGAQSFEKATLSSTTFSLQSTVPNANALSVSGLQRRAFLELPAPRGDDWNRIQSQHHH